MLSMHDVDSRDAVRYMLPSIFIVVVMVIVLSISFWRYHVKKLNIRKMQMEYSMLNLNVKRPRIGAVHCFSHSNHLAELALSFSTADFSHSAKERQGITGSGFDLYGNPLGVLKEEKSVFHQPGRIFPQDAAQNSNTAKISGHNISVNQKETQSCYPAHVALGAFQETDLYDEPIVIRKPNAYYEENGLPVPERKPRFVHKKEDRPLKKQYSLNRMNTIYTQAGLEPSTYSKGGTVELNNRLNQPFARSPRRLPNLENSHWNDVDVHRVVEFGGRERHNSLTVFREESRSLSHQYEYELICTSDMHKPTRREKRKAWKSIVRREVLPKGSSKIICENVQDGTKHREHSPREKNSDHSIRQTGVENLAFDDREFEKATDMCNATKMRLERNIEQFVDAKQESGNEEIHSESDVEAGRSSEQTLKKCQIERAFWISPEDVYQTAV